MHTPVSQNCSTHGFRERTCLWRGAARPRQLIPIKSTAEVTVSLRTISEHVIERTVMTPCTAAEAKAAGRGTLEALFGTSVKFHSYQPGPGQPEMQLADADLVQHGAVLNYTTEPPGVLEQVLQLVADQKRCQEDWEKKWRQRDEEQQQIWAQLRQRDEEMKAQLRQRDEEMKAQLRQRDEEQQQNKAQLRILVERELLALVSKYSSRFLRAPTEVFKKKDTIKTLVETDLQLASAVTAVLRSAGSPLTAVQFAGGLDNTYAQRNVHQHLNTDQQLEAEFRNMRAAGVVKLLKDKMPLECLIVEHFEEFLKLVRK